MMAPVISSSGGWIWSFWCRALCCHGGTAGGGLVFGARFVGLASSFVVLEDFPVFEACIPRSGQCSSTMVSLKRLAAFLYVVAELDGPRALCRTDLQFRR
jgi:hypothetical protein